MHEPGASTSHMCACSATASSQTSPCRAHTHRHTSTPLTRARARAHTHTCQRHHRLDQAVGQRGLEEEGRPPSSEAVPPPACTHTRVMHRRAEGGKRGQTRGDRDTPARGTKVTSREYQRCAYCDVCGKQGWPCDYLKLSHCAKGSSKCTRLLQGVP